MGKLEIGLYDVFTQATMAQAPTAADVYDEHIRTAQEAEQLGYKYYFSIEHQTSTISYLSAPNVYLMALARSTSAIRFGVMIYQLPFHHPIRLAQDAAMLDHLSRGRLEFGAGTGVSPHEFLRWNVPFERRREISEEALDIIIKAWTEDSVTYDGEFFQFLEVMTTPKPYQQPHPPVWFAAHSAASFEYAARRNFHVSQNIDIDPVIGEKFAPGRQFWKECGHTGPYAARLLDAACACRGDRRAGESGSRRAPRHAAYGGPCFQRCRPGDDRADPPRVWAGRHGHWGSRDARAP
jgi:alkanesulfonate monooxygenase SsuD/methylene tetrahydromethanopterin reductase-like flavin-dependent oxidoreductase (luciferase family)